MKPDSSLIRAFRNTPLHPQWLLPGASVVLSMVTPAARGLVLDVGCADRWVEARLEPGCRYLGLDYVATGQELYGACPDMFGDALCLPIQDNAVDTMLLLDVLEHLPKPEVALGEAQRVMAPGGCLVLSVPFLYPVHDAPYDFQRVTVHGLSRMVSDAGLLVERVETYGHAAEVAGLLSAICLGGVALQCWKRKGAWLLPILPLAALIPLVNLVAWCAARVLPNWPAMYGGVNLLARKVP